MKLELAEQHRPFFRAQHARTQFTLGRSVFEIEVETPDLTDAPRSFHGDWGPMYTCSLRRRDVVSVTYRRPETGEVARYSVRPPTIGVHSPMRAMDRERYPFQLVVDDVARMLRFVIKLDRGARCSHVEVLPLNTSVSPVPLMFRDSVQGLQGARPLEASA